ncbi:uncharacterized protein LOC141567890 [Rhinolophus sinicus]|uniref:uncharacterized protein LOC141567890 n=1 Tax=Rhinolophus sinicus TaxID=89399 RepID=UPI003D7A7C5E
MLYARKVFKHCLVHRWLRPPLAQDAPRSPGSKARGLGAAAFYPKRSIKLDSQRLQDGLPARRLGHRRASAAPYRCGKTPSAKRLQHDNGKVSLHVHSASTGAPNLPVEPEIRDPVGPLRGPPVRAGGQARLCRLASGRGRTLHWLGSPSQLGVEAATGHGLAESPLPRGRRCPVAHPWRKRNAELANPSQRPASRGSSPSGRTPGPRCSPLPRPVSGRAEARAGSGSSRALGKAWRGHDHGRRRVSGGSAGSGGEGLPRPAKAQGSRPPAVPVRAGADHWQPVRLPSSDGALVSFSPVAWRDQSPRVSVWLCIF